jgi:hypothetical protein
VNRATVSGSGRASFLASLDHTPKFTCNQQVCYLHIASRRAITSPLTANIETEPRLAPPGAGLPRAELFIARLLFQARRLRGDRKSFNAAFRRERAAIRAQAETCDDASGARRVLIARVRGMEDSSRYWSVWMTLDHLRIVNGQIARVIGSLAKGQTVPGKASTAAVKPDPQVTSSVVADYEAACGLLLETVAAVPDLKTAARFAHPWFGPLDAAGWHALAGSHMGIHRVQIERILKGG